MSILRRVTPGRYAARRRRLVIAADSVAAGRRAGNEVLSGWGQHLGELVGEGVEVVNTASDSCTTHWYFRNRLPAVLEASAPGDIFLIGFGVCEQAMARPDLYRTPREFRAYLNLYVDVLRDRDLTPVLATQVARHLFDPDGAVRQPVGGYSEHTRRVAADRGVALLDLEVLTTGLLAGCGPERARGYYRWFDAGYCEDHPDGIIDTLHLNRQGARAVARLAVDGLYELGLVSRAADVSQRPFPEPMARPLAAPEGRPSRDPVPPVRLPPPVVLTPRGGGSGHPTQRFTGTAEPGTGHVLLTQGDAFLGVAGVGATGRWQWRRTVTWEEGHHEVSVVAVSPRGRSAPAPLRFEVVARVPAPEVSAPQAGSLNGPGPVFKGTVAPGVRSVAVQGAGRWLGQAELTDGSWRFRLPHDWQPGRHTITFTAVADGGTSRPAHLPFEVLAVPPGNWLHRQGDWQGCATDRPCLHIGRHKPAGASNILD
ncbi:GDSL-type esterase/lipase family protein [Streptomyces sp. NPDC089919]|uniref:GDSL-type esterase/lipase family protein n=1 Tax=Streptomyces sp. NPDC089919 TaxID=3155188 RepID=UPI0034453A3B